MKAMAITTKDIARMANVSQSTVSRCLNNSPMISEETKRKVLKIAEENGFQFNANARSLSAKKTYTIGLILPARLFDAGLDLHFRNWQNEIIENLERMEFDVVVSFMENRFSKQNNIKRLVAANKIDGLIIIEPHMDEDTYEVLEKAKIPYVFCKYLPPFYQIKHIDYVCVDQYKGGFIAGEYLAEKGHKRITTISSNQFGNEFKLRTDGFKAALHEHSIPFEETSLLYGNSTFESGYQAIIDHEHMLQGITAIFAQNDLMALGAIRALTELGKDVPNDVSVIGYDDIDLCTFYKPYLTTIHQPTKETATLTCQRLMEMLHSKEESLGLKQKIKISPYLVERESCLQR